MGQGATRIVGAVAALGSAWLLAPACGGPPATEVPMAPPESVVVAAPGEETAEDASAAYDALPDSAKEESPSRRRLLLLYDRAVPLHAVGVGARGVGQV